MPPGGIGIGWRRSHLLFRRLGDLNTIWVNSLLKVFTLLACTGVGKWYESGDDVARRFLAATRLTSLDGVIGIIPEEEAGLALPCEGNLAAVPF